MIGRIDRLVVQKLEFSRFIFYLVGSTCINQNKSYFICEISERFKLVLYPYSLLSTQLLCETKNNKALVFGSGGGWEGMG